MTDDANVVVIAYGAPLAPPVASSSRREKGIRAGMLRLITVWPFPEA